MAAAGKERIIWVARRLVSLGRPSELRRTVELRRGFSTIDARRERRWIERTANALRSTIRPTDPNGPIWAVTMVKNEQDIIEDAIRNLFEQGIDRMLVADNGSTDATRSILERLTGELPLAIIDDDVVAFWQSEKMSMLSRVATGLGAAWIVPFDADEFWQGDDGRTVAEVLRDSDADIITATWFQYVAADEVPGDRITDRFRYRMREASAHKVAFRASWLARIAVGNHSVSLPAPTTVDGLRIAHFRFRSAEQMLGKARDGARAVRVSGLDTRASFWFALEDADHEAAVAFGEVDPDTIIFDPVSAWRTGH